MTKIVVLFILINIGKLSLMKINKFIIDNEIINLNNMNFEQGLLIRYIISCIFKNLNDTPYFESSLFQELKKYNLDNVFFKLEFEINKKNYILEDFISNKSRLNQKTSTKKILNKILNNDIDLITEKEIGHIFQGRVLNDYISYYNLSGFNEFYNYSTKKLRDISNIKFRNNIFENCLIEKDKFLQTRLLFKHLLLCWAEYLYSNRVQKQEQFIEIKNKFENLYNLIQNIAKDFKIKSLTCDIDLSRIQLVKEGEMLDIDFYIKENRTLIILIDIILKTFKLNPFLDIDLNLIKPLIFIHGNNLIDQELIKKYIPKLQIINIQ